MPSSARCFGCDDDDDPSSLWATESVLQCQKAGDLLISLAYFSISLELLYFVTCSAVFPFRWLLLQFGAFIVLCGLTHLLAAFTLAPHSFFLFLAVTVLKLLTALVSVATAITLVPLLPQLLRAFVRDGLLRRKAQDLDRHVGILRRREAAGWRVRALTAEIRRSLDRHVILRTTLLHLSTLLSLEDSAVWAPAAGDSLALAHQLNRRRRQVSVPAADPDVAEILSRNGAVVLDPASDLARAGSDEPVGPAAAIRLPVLSAADFNGGSGAREIVHSSYAVLVLVLPATGERTWTSHELEIVEVVVDQVAVALSHAAVLEESLAIKEELMDRNAALDKAHQEAVLAKEARESFQSVMAKEMTGPIRSVAAMLSALQTEELKPEQMALVKRAVVLSSFIKEATCIGRFEEKKGELRLRPLDVRPVVEEVVGMARVLCACRGVSFEFEVVGGSHGAVIGDGYRILQAVLYMVGNMLGVGEGGTVFLQLRVENGSSRIRVASGEVGVEKGVFVDMKFEVSRIDATDSGESNVDVCGHGHMFSICEKLAQLIDGSVSVSQTSVSGQQSMKLVIRLKCQQQDPILPKHTDLETARCLFRGLRILLADRDIDNIYLARKVLENFECHLSVVSSWYQCLETLYLKEDHFHLLLVDLQILEDDRFELSARIRKLCTESSLLVVALTPKADAKTRDQCLRIGIHGVMCKPVILQEMVDEMQRITQRLLPPPPLN